MPERPEVSRISRAFRSPKLLQTGKSALLYRILKMRIAERTGLPDTIIPRHSASSSEFVADFPTTSVTPFRHEKDLVALAFSSTGNRGSGNP
jgi:hypothetical protein